MCVETHTPSGWTWSRDQADGHAIDEQTHLTIHLAIDVIQHFIAQFFFMIDVIQLIIGFFFIELARPEKFL